MALLNIEDRFNRRLKYPYVLFLAEDEIGVITDEIRSKINWITEGRASFGTYILPLSLRPNFNVWK
jgi:mannosyltransferase